MSPQLVLPNNPVPQEGEPTLEMDPVNPTLRVPEQDVQAIRAAAEAANAAMDQQRVERAPRVSRGRALAALAIAGGTLVGAVGALNLSRDTAAAPEVSTAMTQERATTVTADTHVDDLPDDPTQTTTELPVTTLPAMSELVAGQEEPATTETTQPEVTQPTVTAATEALPIPSTTAPAPETLTSTTGPTEIIIEGPSDTGDTAPATPPTTAEIPEPTAPEPAPTEPEILPDTAPAPTDG